MDNEKKYKALVGKIKKAYLYAQTDSTKAVLEDILPELKESEDEKIRKDIISFLRSKNGYMNPNEDWDFHNRWIPWLEKQGEKPQGKSALEAIKEKPVDNANKIASAWNSGYCNGYIQAVEKASEWLYQRQAVDLEVSDIDKFVNEFKKAMKGGEG